MLFINIFNYIQICFDIRLLKKFPLLNVMCFYVKAKKPHHFVRTCLDSLLSIRILMLSLVVVSVLHNDSAHIFNFGLCLILSASMLLTFTISFACSAITKCLTSFNFLSAPLTYTGCRASNFII